MLNSSRVLRASRPRVHLTYASVAPFSTKKKNYGSPEYLAQLREYKKSLKNVRVEYREHVKSNLKDDVTEDLAKKEQHLREKAARDAIKLERKTRNMLRHQEEADLARKMKALVVEELAINRRNSTAKFEERSSILLKNLIGSTQNWLTTQEQIDAAVQEALDFPEDQDLLSDQHFQRVLSTEWIDESLEALDEDVDVEAMEAREIEVLERKMALLRESQKRVRAIDPAVASSHTFDDDFDSYVENAVESRSKGA